MPPKGGGGPQQFWNAIQSQKQDTIRWCFNYGGITPFTRDDDGYCGIHKAAMSGKVRSLESILDHIRRSVMGRGGGDIRGPNARKKRYEELDTKDEDVGMTPLMWACKGGYYECAILLHECGASIDIKSDEGFTAQQYAKHAKREEIIKWFERGCLEEEEPEDDTVDEEYIEGETATERRKRIKAKKAGLDKFANISKKTEAAGGKEDEEELPDPGPGPDPKWEEIIACRQGNLADLICLRQDSKDTEVDESLWYCRQVNNLKLRMPAGVLGELPAQLELLRSLTTLIVSHNALQRLPPEIKDLKQLKNLEFTDNKVTELPREMEALTQLEVIDACRNQLVNVAPLKALDQLVTLKLDQNSIKSLSLQYKKLTRLTTLSASHNELSSVDDKISRLGALTSLNLCSNSIKELPCEMGDMKEKVLVHLNLDDNPLKDSKVKKILEKGRAPIKELLAHLRKEQESGKKKKKKAKEEDDDDEEEEEEGGEKEEEKEEEEPEPVKEEPKAAAAGGGGGGGGGKKKGKGKGKGGGGPQMTEAQKEAARAEALRKLGMPVPAKKEEKKEEVVPPSPKVTEPPTPSRGLSGFEDDDADEAAAQLGALDLGEEADEEDFSQFMSEEAAPDVEQEDDDRADGEEEEEDEDDDDDDDLGDFLSAKPKKKKPTESKEDRDARIKRELESRKIAQAAMEKEKEQKRKEHEEWLAAMSPEERQRYQQELERKRRQDEEAQREAEAERERRMMEEQRRKAGASAAAGAASQEDAKAKDRMENKWTYVGDKLVATQVERKGPKKPVKEIKLKFPQRKIGAIIGKAGVNIRIIEGKSHARLQIHKQKPADGEAEDALVTIKGSQENIDVACETINMVLEQFKAARRPPQKK